MSKQMLYSIGSDSWGVEDWTGTETFDKELKLEKLLWDLKSTLGQYIKKITGFSDISVMAICCVFECFAEG